MKDLKFALETRDYSYLLATIKELKHVRLNKKVRKTINTMEKFLSYGKNTLIYGVYTSLPEV